MIGGVGVVVIVGRPNVGKSALFNRIVGAQRAIVDDVPGVTRDRLVAVASHGGRRFLCVDTGGFHAEPEHGALAARVRDTALAALEDADAVLCVVDGQSGVLPDDTALMRLARKTGKPLVIAVNKLDVPSQDVGAAEFHASGASDVVGVSAAHRRGITELLDAVTMKLPETPAEPVAAEGVTRIALIGRPNVGKSSLLNRLCGEERALVSPEPGTTRDVIDTPLAIEGRSYLLLDTAGIRRRGRITDRIERHGAVRALAAMERADLVLLVLDASEGMTDQDARLAGRALEAGRGLLLLANKWDLLDEEARAAALRRGALTRTHPGLSGLPMVPVSALHGDGMARLFPALRRVERSYDKVFQTATLNRAVQTAVREHAPASARGRAVRVFYATQTGRRPPEITMFVNDPAAVSADYRRYLANRLTQVFGLSGVTLRIACRRRRAQRGRPSRR